jgi:hypothetical protein
MVSMSAAIAGWRVRLLQIRFVLLPVARTAYRFWGRNYYLPLWLLQLWFPDERRGWITEAVNPMNESINVIRVEISLVARTFLHDFQQFLRQIYRTVAEVEEMVGEENPTFLSGWFFGFPRHACLGEATGERLRSHRSSHQSVCESQCYSSGEFCEGASIT